MEELLRDSSFPYQVGRLAGAAEVLAHWLMVHGDDEAKAMGAKLDNVVAWFFFPEEPQ